MLLNYRTQSERRIESCENFHSSNSRGFRDQDDGGVSRWSMNRDVCQSTWNDECFPEKSAFTHIPGDKCAHLTYIPSFDSTLLPALEWWKIRKEIFVCSSAAHAETSGESSCVRSIVNVSAWSSINGNVKWVNYGVDVWGKWCEMWHANNKTP